MAFGMGILPQSARLVTHKMIQTVSKHKCQAPRELVAAESSAYAYLYLYVVHNYMQKII